MECSDIISQTQSLSFRVPSSHFMNTQSQSRQNFPANQRRADEYVQLKVCSISVFNSCNIGSIINFVLVLVLLWTCKELRATKNYVWRKSYPFR